MSIIVPCLGGGGGSTPTIPNGKTVTPTDDIQTWLHCAGIFDNNYTTLAQVLNDTVLYNALLSDANACDYLARSTSWAVNEGAVPNMTSDTTPSGDVTKSSQDASNQYYAWKLFDGNNNTAWAPSAYTSSGAWAAYTFTEAINISSFMFRAVRLSGSIALCGVNLQAYVNNEWQTFKTISEIGATATTIKEDITPIIGATAIRVIATGTTSNIYCYEFQVYSDADITTSETAMRLLGKYDYACEALLSVPTWCEAISNSDYYEYVLNVSVPTMTSNTAPYGTAFSINPAYSLYPQFQAFDKNMTTRYSPQTAGVFPDAIGYEFTEPVVVKVVDVSPYFYTGGVALSDYQIQASNNKSSSNWEVLYSGTFDSSNPTQRCFLQNDTAYTCYRLYVTTTPASYLSILELQFYGRTPVNETKYVPLVPMMTSDTTPEGQCFASSVHTDAVLGSQAWNAFDGNYDKAWHANTQQAFPQSVGYRFTNAIEANMTKVRPLIYQSNSRLKQYKIQGSNDNSTWFDLTEILTADNQTSGTPMTQSGCQAGSWVTVYFTKNISSYQYYQLVVISSWDSNKAAIVELQFYAIRGNEPAIIHCATDDEITITGDDFERVIYADGDTATLPSDIPAGLYTLSSAIYSNPSYPDQPYIQNVYITEHVTEIYFIPPNMETVLWTNSAPTSSFASQTVTLSDSMDNYKYLAFKYRVNTSVEGDTTNIYSVEDIHKMLGSGTNNVNVGSLDIYVSGGNTYSRQIGYSSDTAILFKDSYRLNAQASANTTCIPTEIIGLNKLATAKVAKKTKTTLWTNPSPASSFSNQTITLSDDLDNYDYVELEYAFNSSTLTNKNSIIYTISDFKRLTANDGWCGAGIVYSNSYLYSRSLTYNSDTAVNFGGTLKYNSGTAPSAANTATIPLKVYGIKYECEDKVEKYTETSLWLNPSPTAAFATQSVTLSKGLSNFKYLKIIWNINKSSSSDSDKGQMILPVDNFDTTYDIAPYIASYSGAVTYVRSFIKVNDTTISIGTAYRVNASGNNNDAVIPLEILGLNELNVGQTTVKPIITVMYQGNYANYFTTVLSNGTFDTSGLIGGTSPSKLVYENDYFKMQMNAASNHNGTITFKVVGTYYENLNAVPQTAVHKDAGATWSGAMYTQAGSVFVPD